jgi:hypothetical protein
MKRLIRKLLIEGLLNENSNYSAKDIKEYESLHNKHKGYKNNYLNISYDDKDPLLDELKKVDFPNGLFSYLIDERRPDLVDYFPYNIKLYSTESKEFPSPDSGWTSKDGFLGLNDGSELRLFIPVQNKIEVLPTLWMLLHEFRHKMQHENDNIGGITSDDNPNKGELFDFIGKETGADRNTMNHVFHEIDPMEIDANVFACEFLDIPYNGSSKFDITNKTLKKLKIK